MKSREEIFAHVTALMTKMFDLEPSLLTEEARIYDELDIDSIDAVDLMIELTAYTGEKITPEDFRNVRSIGDIVDALEIRLNG